MAKNKSLVPLKQIGKTLWSENGDRMDGAEPSAAKHSVGYVVGRGIADEFNYAQYRAEEQLDAIVRERVASHYTQITAEQARLQIATGRWAHDWGRIENDNNYVYSGVASSEIEDICSAFNSFGEPLLLALDNSVQKIRVFNPRTGALLDTSDDLKDDLPTGGGEDWQVWAMCSDGTSVYVFCTDINPGDDEHLVQAWDIATWDVKAGWPATGTVLPGVGNRNRGQNEIIIANDTYLATANSWTAITDETTKCVSVIELSDGTLGAGFSGAGDGTATYAILSLASDGTYLYCSSESGGEYELSTAKITDPDNAVGTGGTGYPLALGAQGPHAITSCGDLIVTSTGTSTSAEWDDIVISTHNATTAVLGKVARGRNSMAEEGGDKFIFSQCHDLTYDGFNLWVTVLVESTASDGPVCFLKIDVAKLMDRAPAVVPHLPDITTGIFQTPVTSTPFKPTWFDGRDLWTVGQPEGSQTLSGRLYRLPCALLRN